MPFSFYILTKNSQKGHIFYALSSKAQRRKRAYFQTHIYRTSEYQALLFSFSFQFLMLHPLMTLILMLFLTDTASFLSSSVLLTPRQFIYKESQPTYIGSLVQGYDSRLGCERSRVQLPVKPYIFCKRGKEELLMISSRDQLCYDKKVPWCNGQHSGL